jgi:hypothetical protein
VKGLGVELLRQRPDLLCPLEIAAQVLQMVEGGN